MTLCTSSHPAVRELSGDSGSGCRLAFFDRHGGSSSPPFASLNVGLHVGDSKAAVLANREQVKARLGVTWLLSARQTHGVNIHHHHHLHHQHQHSGTLAADCEVADSDALITGQPDVALMIQQADCQGVLLFDPGTPAIGAVHSGWRGSVQNIVGLTVAAMKDSFGSDPARILAFISPSLGPCCAEFVHYRHELPESFVAQMVSPNHFDFWAISTEQLVEAGLERDNIEVSGVCTCCNKNYFSYRRAKRGGSGDTGRQCSVIALSA